MLELATPACLRFNARMLFHSFIVIRTSDDVSRIPAQHEREGTSPLSDSYRILAVKNPPAKRDIVLADVIVNLILGSDEILECKVI